MNGENSFLIFFDMYWAIESAVGSMMQLATGGVQLFVRGV